MATFEVKFTQSATLKVIAPSRAAVDKAANEVDPDLVDDLAVAGSNMEDWKVAEVREVAPLTDDFPDLILTKDGLISTESEELASSEEE